VQTAFFMANNEPNTQAMQSLQQDITQLLIPSPARALLLNKAYKVIVNEQSYILGRDPVVTPLFDTVFTEMQNGDETGLSETIMAR